MTTLPPARWVWPLVLLLLGCGRQGAPAVTSDSTRVTVTPDDSMPAYMFTSSVLMRIPSTIYQIPKHPGYIVLIEDSTDTLANLRLEEDHRKPSGYAMGSVYRFLGIKPADTLRAVYKIINETGTDELFVFANDNPPNANCSGGPNIRVYRIHYDERHYINRIDVIPLESCYDNAAIINLGLSRGGVYNVYKNKIRFCVLGAGMNNRMYEYDMYNSEISMRIFAPLVDDSLEAQRCIYDAKEEYGLE